MIKFIQDLEQLGLGAVRRMIHTSSIRHPEKCRFISLYKWQVEFCQGNHCAALLLSFFSVWHDWKLTHDIYYRRVNDIAEMHGDSRSENQNAYLFFSTDDLIEGCINLYGKKAIVDAVDHLACLGVISIHKNPNPRYHFDKTKYFKFYPEICNKWLAESYSKLPARRENIDSPKTPYAISKNILPTRENNRAITNNTNKFTNKLIKEDGNIFDNMSDYKTKVSGDIQKLADALISAGMPESRLISSDDIETLKSILKTGAPIGLILDAYSDAVRATRKRKSSFGTRYLAKAVISKLTAKKMNIIQNQDESYNYSEPHYRNDLENARSFAADVL